MADQVLEAVFRQVLNSRYAQGDITVLWHAGEPLVLPRSWYERAFEQAERHRPAKLRLRHAFQTNGVLLNPSWASFIKQHGAGVGLSIDGPARLHDARRRTRTGRGSHAQAMQGVHNLQDADVPFHVITVLSDESLDAVDEMYEFYCAEGLTEICFNVEEVEGANRESSLTGAIKERRFRRFLARFFALLRSEPGRLHLREWDGAAAVLASREPAGHCQETDGLRILSVDVAGNVSSFSPEFLGMSDPRYGNFCFGNIMEEPLRVIAARIMRSRLQADILAGVEACRRECEWFGLCGGGAPSNKLYELGRVDGAETMACRLTRKGVLDLVLTQLESELELSHGR